jgi:hypothetical protein
MAFDMLSQSQPVSDSIPYNPTPCNIYPQDP